MGVRQYCFFAILLQTFLNDNNREMSNNDLSVTAAVVFAGLAISASVVYVGMQLDDVSFGDSGTEKRIEKQGEDEGKVAGDVKDDLMKLLANDIESDPTAEKVRKIDPDYDHILGNEEARITIYEYSDFECPYCRTVHPTLERVVEDYEGDVNWVYRHFPLSFHEPAASAMAEASECVAEVGGNDKFWEFSSALYDGQATGEDASLVALAETLGVDGAAVQTCLDSDKYLERIAKDLQEGSDAGVSGTPGNIIFDHETGTAIALPGAQPIGNFKSKIDALLAQ